MTRTPMPDLGIVIVAWLEADTDLHRLNGHRFGDRLPAAETRSYVAVTISGGTTLLRGWARDRRITVNCWGPSSERSGHEQLAELAEHTRCRVEELTDQTFGGVVFGAVDIVSDLFWLPDTTFMPARPRYVFTARAVCHPTPD